MASTYVAPFTAVKTDALQAIGNTPLVDVSILSPDPKIKIYGKLESVNPTGSVKDRAARSLIQTAEKEGLIKPGDTILEPTSGNTGLGLAMIGRIKGYNVKVVMPASVPPERVHLLEAFGAEVILSHKDKGTNESILVAKQLSEENPSFHMPYQYGNLANPRAHYTTTGPEIARDMPDVNAFVAGLGTGGTLMGVGKALREHNPDVEIIATAPHPDDKVQGLRSIEHGFIPPILDLDKLDGRILVDGEEAFYWTRRLLTDAGYFVGVSSGATFATARKIAQKWSKEGREGKIVCMFADGGWKYLSTGIYGEDFKFNQSEIEGKTWW